MENLSRWQAFAPLQPSLWSLEQTDVRLLSQSRTQGSSRSFRKETVDELSILLDFFSEGWEIKLLTTALNIPISKKDNSKSLDYYIEVENFLE